jgi:predicted ATP-binding protein involved in virulence
LLKIKRLVINNVNNLKDTEIQLNENFNIICGQNGSGKTTILNCILSSFQRKRLSNLYVNALENHGFWEIEYYNNYEYNSRVHYIDKDLGQKDTNTIKGDRLIITNFIISFTVNNRNMTALIYGRNPLTSWFIENYSNSDLNHSKEINYSLAKECFGMIDPNVYFDRIDIIRDRPRKNFYSKYINDERNLQIGIYVRTSKGSILIEQMSSGYQSVLMILLSLIRKIETLDRYGTSVHNYEGILLIDEIDLYLHPEWQKKLIEIIRWLIPKAQIITTTHSPHIIQTAMPNEIIPLGVDMNGDTYIRKLPESNQYGYQGWTIEEILTDVMGLKETRSDEYKKVISQFGLAIDNEDIKNAKIQYKKMESMLHPQNHSLKLLRLQMASLGGTGK